MPADGVAARYPGGVAGPDMAGFRTLGRLLGVGAAAGAGIGGSVGAVVGAGIGAWFGVLVGVVAGPLTQVVGYSALLVARRRGAPARAHGPVVVAVAVAGALATVTGVLAPLSRTDPPPAWGTPLALTSVLALAVGLLTAPWCLRPLERDGVGSTSTSGR